MFSSNTNDSIVIVDTAYDSNNKNIFKSFDIHFHIELCSGLTVVNVIMNVRKANCNAISIQTVYT